MTDQKPYEVSKLKPATLLLIDLASAFTRGKLTVEQGLTVLAATSALMRENKQARPGGGIEAALAQLYTDKDLPVALMERVVLCYAPTSTYRENLANGCDSAIAMLEDLPPATRALPWRDGLAVLFDALAMKKEDGKSGLSEIKKQYHFHNEQDELDPGEGGL